MSGVNLPAAGLIARNLINELDGFERDFVLVLDDYHTIREQSIHELLSLLLQHPPKGLHLVVTTRQDPPLPLGVLRARNQVLEIRGQDLRFSVPEVAAFWSGRWARLWSRTLWLCWQRKPKVGPRGCAWQC